MTTDRIPQEGETWKARHTRKGPMTCKLVRDEGEWLRISVRGPVKMMGEDGRWEQAQVARDDWQELTVRASFMRWIKCVEVAS